MVMAISLALGPETRMMPTPPRPGAVAMAAIVSVCNWPKSIVLLTLFIRD